MKLLRSVIGVVLIITISSAMTRMLAQTFGAPVEFTAFAVNTNTFGPSATGTVQIAVERWSTNAERDQFLAALQESSPDKQRDALQKLRRVGYIRTPDSIGYELRFARQDPDRDGGRRVLIATDRPIGVWEAMNRPRVSDYPFTFIEIHMGHGETGEGKMSVATRVVADRDRNVVELERYSAQPVLLQNVQERKR